MPKKIRQQPEQVLREWGRDPPVPHPKLSFISPRIYVFFIPII